jgi:hypothetical protein
MAAFIVQRKSLAFGYPEAACSSPDYTWNPSMIHKKLITEQPTPE